MVYNAASWTVLVDSNDNARYKSSLGIDTTVSIILLLNPLDLLVHHGLGAVLPRPQGQGKSPARFRLDGC